MRYPSRIPQKSFAAGVVTELVSRLKSGFAPIGRKVTGVAGRDFDCFWALAYRMNVLGELANSWPGARAGRRADRGRRQKSPGR
jgi:hypothetical protein